MKCLRCETRTFFYICTMKTLELPEWAFLDADNHTGNQLKGRDVLLHIRTNTAFEVFSKNKVKLKSNIPHRNFQVKNVFGVEEEFIIAIHFTFAQDTDEIFSKAIKFYTDWIHWTDRTIIKEDTAKLN